jgi:arsenical-resistance protein 2
MATENKEPKWWEKYPNPQSEPEYVENTKVLEALKSTNDPDFLIIDLRGDDFHGGRIKTSLNLPATSIFPSINGILNLAEKSGITTIYLHCNRCTKGSSRAWRVGGWLQDAVNACNSPVKIYAITGGIADWARGGSKFTDLMVEYEPSAWK